MELIVNFMDKAFVTGADGMLGNSIVKELLIRQ